MGLIDTKVEDSRKKSCLIVMMKFKDKLNQWRTGTAVGAKTKNVSYVYKSVDDVMAEGQFRKEDRARGEGVKVIDMTGREQRVLEGL